MPWAPNLMPIPIKWSEEVALCMTPMIPFLLFGPLGGSEANDAELNLKAMVTPGRRTAHCIHGTLHFRQLLLPGGD